MKRSLLSISGTLVPVIFFFALLPSCTSKKEGLSKLWFFTHASGTLEGKDTLLKPVSFLQLSKDGTYTRDFGKFEYGEWGVEDGELFLKADRGKTQRLNIRKKEKEMQLTLDNGAVAYFESQPLPGDDLSENPFAKENNLWRIPASKKETDEEIKKRLRNHCRFWEAYFNWALKKEYSSVDVRSTPTLIKIYGNGFGLKPMEELPHQWVSYFYDTADCRRANDQLKYVIEHHDIAWAHTNNKYKMFVGAFQQLQQYLR